MGKKRKRPIYKTRKPTVNLDKISGTASTSEESKPGSYGQREYGESVNISSDYKGEKGKAKQKSVISVKNISIIFTIVVIIGGIIWYFAGLDSDVNYIKDELKIVKEKTEKLSESSVGQEVRITNIDNNLREMHSEIRELNNKIYENSKNNN